MERKTENIEEINKGMRILLVPLTEYVYTIIKKIYGTGWWYTVYTTLNSPREFPTSGTDENLKKYLDVQACLKLIQYLWNDVFKYKLEKHCKNWVHELIAIRNEIAHASSGDFSLFYTEHCLSTIYLFCNEIDEESAKKIKNIYDGLRDENKDKMIKQPDIEEGIKGDLLTLVGTEFVQKTDLTRKITFGDKTQTYPVYRVRLNTLYYNDQNDRIATWISRYEADNGKDSLTGLSKATYNNIIEDFIYSSNPDAIQKTQNNIKLVGQQVPGVTLADGRIVDGNRRYTCLRRTQRETPEPLYFETVILNTDFKEEKKQIKLLELSIQHGEEKKVEFDLIDFAIGTYRDIVETKLIDIKEYSRYSNESVAEISKRLEIARLIDEFLNFISLSGQYYAAREYKVYSLFQEMIPIINKLDAASAEKLKELAFVNVAIHAVPDLRQFIRNEKVIAKSDGLADYLEKQSENVQFVKESLNNSDIRFKEDVEEFAENNIDIAFAIKQQQEFALQKARNKDVKNKPLINVNKCISLLNEIDTHLFNQFDDITSDDFSRSLTELEGIIKNFKYKINR